MGKAGSVAVFSACPITNCFGQVLKRLAASINSHHSPRRRGFAFDCVNLQNGVNYFFSDALYERIIIQKVT